MLQTDISAGVVGAAPSTQFDVARWSPTSDAPDPRASGAAAIRMPVDKAMAAVFGRYPLEITIALAAAREAEATARVQMHALDATPLPPQQDEQGYLWFLQRQARVASVLAAAVIARFETQIAPHMFTEGHEARGAFILGMPLPLPEVNEEERMNPWERADALVMTSRAVDRQHARLEIADAAMEQTHRCVREGRNLDFQPVADALMRYERHQLLVARDTALMDLQSRVPRTPPPVVSSRGEHGFEIDPARAVDWARNAQPHWQSVMDAQPLAEIAVISHRLSTLYWDANISAGADHCMPFPGSTGDLGAAATIRQGILAAVPGALAIVNAVPLELRATSPENRRAVAAEAAQKLIHLAAVIVSQQHPLAHAAPMHDGALARGVTDADAATVAEIADEYQRSQAAMASNADTWRVLIDARADVPEGVLLSHRAYRLGLIKAVGAMPRAMRELTPSGGLQSLPATTVSRGAAPDPVIDFLAAVSGFGPVHPYNVREEALRDRAVAIVDQDPGPLLPTPAYVVRPR